MCGEVFDQCCDFARGKIGVAGIVAETDVENVINVYNDDGSYIKFIRVQNGLYCINLDDSGDCTNFLTTVSE